MKKYAKAMWCTLLMLMLALCVSTARGQQPSNPPVPSEPPSTAQSAGQAPAPTPTAQLPPERSPLTGAEQFTLRQMGRKRSFLLAGFDFLQLADSNAPISSTESNLVGTSTLLGHLGVGRISSKYQFIGEYRGGGYIYTSQSQLDTSFHDLAVQQRIAGRRWNFWLTEEFGYLPESAFGFSGFGATQGNLNTNVSPLNPIFQTNQDILTARAPRISNTVVGELERRLGRKSSFTVSASYNKLHFPHGGFVDNSNAVFVGTYNYNPTPRNTLALSYGFSLFRFPGQAQQIYDHLVRAAYQRMITRRLNLQLSAGPELYKFKDTANGNSRQLSWGQQSLLLYRVQRTDLSISYTTYLTGGAGVLPGAQSHDARMTLGRRWSRMWSSSFDLGFARTTALSQTAPQNAKLAAFESGYGDAVVTRQLGRHAEFLLTYGLQFQNSDSSLCTVAVCSGVPAHHIFGLGLSWHLEPASSSQLDYSNVHFGMW